MLSRRATSRLTCTASRGTTFPAFSSTSGPTYVLPISPASASARQLLARWDLLCKWKLYPAKIILRATATPQGRARVYESKLSTDIQALECISFQLSARCVGVGHGYHRLLECLFAQTFFFAFSYPRFRPRQSGLNITITKKGLQRMSIACISQTYKRS